MPFDHLFIGTSGWSYKDWVGPFYPDGMASRDYLREYARHFNTVEVDSTFYGTPRRDSVIRWRDSVPAGFRFCAKFPQTITHEKKLVDCDREVADFLKAMEHFGDKLGVLLLQFAYSFKPDQMDALDHFLTSLPEGFRYAVEVRNRKWLHDDFYWLLKEHNAALVLVDHPWMPRLDRLTADFSYVRWLGDRKKIPGDFSKVQLDRSTDIAQWAEILQQFLVDDVTTYGYVNNHYAGHSPETARAILKQLETT